MTRAAKKNKPTMAKRTTNVLGPKRTIARARRAGTLPASLETALEQSTLRPQTTNVAMASTGAGCVSIKGFEYLGEVKSSQDAAATKLDSIILTQVNAKRLAYLSRVYDFWRPKRMDFHYRPRVGTTTPGRVTIFFDRGMPKSIVNYDTGAVKAIIPEGDAIFNYQPIVSGPAWQNMLLKLPIADIVTRKWYSCAPRVFGQVGERTPVQETDESCILGRVFYQTNIISGGGQTSFGDIWIDYEIEFSGPIAPVEVVPQSLYTFTRGGYYGNAAAGIWEIVNFSDKPYRVGMRYVAKADGTADTTKLQIGVGYENGDTPQGAPAALVWKGPHKAHITLCKGAKAIEDATFKKACTDFVAHATAAGYGIVPGTATSVIALFSVTAFRDTEPKPIKFENLVDGINIILNSDYRGGSK